MCFTETLSIKALEVNSATWGTIFFWDYNHLTATGCWSSNGYFCDDIFFNVCIKLVLPVLSSDVGLGLPGIAS